MKIADRISDGMGVHFSPVTTARTTRDFVDYLASRSKELLRAPEIYLEGTKAGTLESLRSAEAGIAAAEVSLSERIFVGGIPRRVSEAELRAAFEENGIGISGITLPKENRDGANRGYAGVAPPKPGHLDCVDGSPVLPR